MNERTSENGLSGAFEFVQNAIKDAIDTDDEGAIFSEQVIECGLALWTHDQPAYQRTLGVIRKKFSATLMREWVSAVRRAERTQRAEDRAAERSGRVERNEDPDGDGDERDAPL